MIFDNNQKKNLIITKNLDILLSKTKKQGIRKVFNILIDSNNKNIKKE